ncbi:MAG: hypothetical protein H6548_08305 [Chitinophagales bacterium]|nr:hypothetical protein [Chitinophagales bacterium]MCB9022105.1 hypothetical protein [Chitinophagales bacterium]HPR28976.1 hypothetical protein [Chitinophagales bacterium]HRX22956.1 hypothetical protein [Chitinophagales bacterium]
MKLYTLCVCVILGLNSRAQNAFLPGPAIHFGGGLSMPFNDFPDEPAPQVLGFGYTLQLGYSAPARYSERLSYRLTYKQFRNPLGGEKFGDPFPIATGMAKSDALLSDLMLTIGEQNRIIAQPFIGAGVGSTRTPSYLSSGNLVTGGDGIMIEEHIGLLVNTRNGQSRIFLEFRMSYLQMYYIEDISTIYELSRSNLISNLVPEFSLVYAIDLKELLQKIQQ